MAPKGSPEPGQPTPPEQGGGERGWEPCGICDSEKNLGRDLISFVQSSGFAFIIRVN
ncbi:hypothetical protein HMPREF9374_2787 [Desmospora sp. 8437]|nr:hypothetical protein HMPREF9374_2787 [Desmospora sp. 8437]